MSLKNCYWGKLMMLGLGALLMLPGAASAVDVCVVPELYWCSTSRQPCETAADCDPPGQDCVASGTARMPPRCAYLGQYHQGPGSGGWIAFFKHYILPRIQILYDDPIPGIDTELFDSTFIAYFEGEGPLAGFTYKVSIPVAMEVQTTARTPGEPVQTMNNEMVSAVGALEVHGSCSETGGDCIYDTDCPARETCVGADPYFEAYEVTAGSAHGLPQSLGETTFTELEYGNYQVDSYFDVVFQIYYKGRTDGPLAGYEDTIQDTVTMQAFAEEAIPAVSEWGMVVMILLVLAAGTTVFRGLMARRRTRDLAA